MRSLQTVGVVLLGLIISTTGLHAAQLGALDPTKPALRVRKEPVKTEAQVVERGQHHARVEWFLEEEGPDGKIFRQLRGYTRLETGLHYWDAASKTWKETQELIKPTAGGAVADEGPQKVTFSLNVNQGEGSVSIVTPDGQKLRGGVLALAYFDTATQKQVVLALAKDAKGRIVGQNQVIYQDAFEGVNADVLYTYTKAGLMQEVIFRTQPPSPAKVELTPETTLLQVLTEWSELPVLKERVAVTLNQKNSGALSDEKLDFGSVQIGSGKAFWKEGATRKGATPVGKKLVEENGRKILFESVPYLELEESLRGLPDSGWVRVETPKDNSGRVSRRRPDGLYAGGGAMSAGDLLASVATKGVSVDWTVLGSVTNLVLQGDMTYDVAGLVEVENLVIEGGTVVKFEDYTSSQILVTRSVDCQTDSYRPAVFTSVYDGGVGEKIYLGTLARDYAAGGALKVDLTYVTGPIELKNLRFSWAMTGIAISDGGLNTNETQILRNVQFVNCGTGLEIDNAKVGFFNGLVVSDKGTNTTAFDVTGGSLRGEHLTLHKLATLSVGTGSNEVVNTLAVDLGNNPGTLGAGSQNLWNTNGSLVFTNVVFGSHYLPTNSAYLNAGTTNGLDSGLAQSLKLKTTQAPVLYSNYTFSAVTTLGPTVARDSNVPDVGFHYDPLDYIVAKSTVATNLSFTAGTAVGWYYSTNGLSPPALGMNDRQIVTFGGTAENRCYFVRSTLSQEGSAGIYSYSKGGILGTADQDSLDATTSPHLWATFTVFGGLARYDNPYGEYYGYMTVHLTHSEVWNMTAVSYILSQHLTNCFFGRSYSGQVHGWTGTKFTFQNGTMKGGYLDLFRYGTAAPFTVHDVAFDGTLVSEYDDFGGTNLDYSFNAYTNSTDAYRLYPTNANDRIVTNFNWQVGALGSFYLPTSSPILNVGSTSATNVGLHHFTITTNQVKETNSTVDIGYHYVALGTNGLASDLDGDGIADYREDANGNGSVNSGETSWIEADSDFDGISDGEEVANGTDPLNAANAALRLLASFRFNGASLVGDQGQVPNYSYNIASVAGLEGSAAKVVGGDWAKRLGFRTVEANGMISISNGAG